MLGDMKEERKRGDGKARPDRVAERRTGLPWKRKRGGMEGEEDRMEKAEDSAEEGPDRILGDRKGSRERFFGSDGLAKEGKGDPESRPCPDLGRETLGSLLHPACRDCLSFCICEVEMSPTPRGLLRVLMAGPGKVQTQ